MKYGSIHEVWISCPRCSVNYKESVIAGDAYLETSLCSLCRILCEKCEEKPMETNSKLCEYCQSDKKYSEVYNDIDIVSSKNTDIDVIDDLSLENNGYIDEDYVEYINDTVRKPASIILKHDYKSCKLIDKYCIKHPVDSVDAPINGTLGNRSIEVIIEALSDLIDESSIILDLGSGNGKTAAKFSSVLNVVTVGIEYDKLRHECSMVNLKSILKHFNINTTFVHGNIDSYFNSFNGYDVIYMFDTAYVPSTIEKIKQLLNESQSVKALICNSKLDHIGFPVVLYKSLGALTAGNTTRNFYIYKSNIYNNNYIVDEINKRDIEHASNKDTRIDDINIISDEFLNKSRGDKSMEQKNYKELYQLLQKSPVTINGEEFILADQVIGSTQKKQSSYTVFNRQNLSLMNKFEYQAITWNTKYLALKTPAYDGSGEILIRIIHYTVGPTYEAVIYNIRSKIFRKVSVRSLFESNFSFNYKLQIPNGIKFKDIFAKYREQYPVEKLSEHQILSSSGTDVTRKRKPNELFTLEIPVSKRPIAKTIVIKQPTSDATKTKDQLTRLQQKLSQLQEDNNILKRKHKEVEESNKKAKVSDNLSIENSSFIMSQIKSHDREIKDLEKQHEIKMRELELEKEREVMILKDKNEREIKGLEILRERDATERLRNELDRERNSKRLADEELERLRRERELEVKDHYKSQESLFNRMIEMQEDKYHNVRSDAQIYTDKILDLAKTIIRKSDD